MRKQIQTGRGQRLTTSRGARPRGADAGVGARMGCAGDACEAKVNRPMDSPTDGHANSVLIPPTGDEHGGAGRRGEGAWTGRADKDGGRLQMSVMNGGDPDRSHARGQCGRDGRS